MSAQSDMFTDDTIAQKDGHPMSPEIEVGDKVRVKEPNRYASIEGEVKKIGCGPGRKGEKGGGQLLATVVTKHMRYIYVRPSTLEVIERAR